MRSLTKSPLITLAVFLLTLSGCTRKTGSTATLRLDLSSLQAARQAQKISPTASQPVPSPTPSATLPTSAEIAAIIVNISGPGISPNIFKQFSTLSPVLEIDDIPKGDSRLVQMLVVFKSTSTAPGGFWYDEAAKSLSAESEDVYLKLQALGTAGVGDDQIGGRYLTSANAGPTGLLSVYYKVPNHPGSPAMLVDNTQEIFSGFFRSFALEGAQLTYKLDDGTVMFGDSVGADSSALVAAGAQSLRVSVPAFYSSQGSYNGTTTYNAQYPTRSVFGFFGPGAAGKQICYYNSGENINGAYFDAAGATPLLWNPNVAVGGSGYAFVEVGGLKSATRDATNLCVLTGTRFIDYLSLNDGALTQHDSTLGFQGPFVIQPSSGGNTSTISTNLTGGVLSVKWTFLPGVQSGPLGKGIDGVDVFGRVEASSQYDGSNLDYKGNNDSVVCDKLISKNFISLGNVPADSTNLNQGIAFNSLSAAYLAAFSAGMTTTIVCPYAMTGSTKKYFQAAGVAYPGGNNQGGGPATAWSVKFTASPGSPASVYNQTCVPLSVAQVTSGGTPAMGGPGSLTLSDSNNGHFFSNPDCSQQITAWPYNVGTQTQVWYVSPSTVAAGLITASGNSLTNATVSYSSMNAPGPADTILFTGIPSSIQAFKCYPFTLSTVIGGGSTPALYNSLIYPSLTAPTGVYFYSDSNCQSTLASEPFGGAAMGASVYQLYFSYKDINNLGGLTLAFNSSNFPGSSPVSTVNSVQAPGTVSAIKVVFNNNSNGGSNQSYQMNSCLTATISLVDAQGDLSPLTSAMVNGNSSQNIALSSNAGTFYNGSCNSTTASTVYFQANGTQATAQLFFKPTALNSAATATASFAATVPATTITGTNSFVVVPETASKIVYVLAGQTWSPGSSSFGNSIDPEFWGHSYTLDVYAVLASNNMVDTSYISPAGSSLTPMGGAPFTITLPNNSPTIPGFVAADNGHKQLKITFANGTGTPYYLQNGSFTDQFGGLQIPTWASYNVGVLAPTLTPSNVFVYAAGNYQPTINTSSCQPVVVQTASAAYGAQSNSYVGTTTAGTGGLIASSQTGTLLFTEPTCTTQASSGTLISNSTNQVLLYAKFASVGYRGGVMNVTASPSGGGFGYDGYGTATAAGSFSQYEFLGPGQGPSAVHGLLTGLCQPYVLGGYDSAHNSVIITQPTVTLSVAGGVSGQFFSDVNCSTAITSVSFSAARTAVFYFKPAMGATNTSTGVLTATDGTNSGSLNINILNFQ